jgi:hypothetical protein
MSKNGDVLVIQPIVRLSSSPKQNKQILSQDDYLDEYDLYNLENEKYFLGGQGGKQRTKKDIVQNVKFDPCKNVRYVTSKLQNFERKRKSSN